VDLAAELLVEVEEVACRDGVGAVLEAVEAEVAEEEAGEEEEGAEGPGWEEPGGPGEVG
jgi:hypothetical protein